MEGKVNYLLVGIFVTLFLAGVFGFAFWLMKYSNYEQMDRYVVYFDESVAGLSKDASVKYMGVDAGIVEDIKVHPTNTQLVAVYLKINHDIVIKEDMQATLKFYGMTGLAYVEISGNNPDAPPLKPKKDEIPIIKSSPSIFAQLDVALADLADKLSSASQKLELLLSEKNIQNVENTLENISAVTGELKTGKTDISNLIKEGVLLEKKASLILKKIDRVTDGIDPEFGKDIQKTLKEFKTASKEMKILMKNINKTVKRGDYDLKKITKPTLQKLSNMIDEISELSIKMEDAVEEIKESPSDLLFKKRAIKPGPGEN